MSYRRFGPSNWARSTASPAAACWSKGGAAPASRQWSLPSDAWAHASRRSPWRASTDPRAVDRRSGGRCAVLISSSRWLAPTMRCHRIVTFHVPSSLRFQSAMYAAPASPRFAEGSAVGPLPVATSTAAAPTPTTRPATMARVTVDPFVAATVPAYEKLVAMFRHTAFATRDPAATHTFYTEAMGFELVKVEVAPTPKGGWAKHFFYDTGGGELMAFWDLHDDTIPDTWSPAISTGLGLPEWVNHLAFAAADLDDLEARKQRWLTSGHDVAEIDHRWCASVYTVDPNGILVEFCTTTKPFTDDDRRDAVRLFADPEPPVMAPPEAKFHRAPARTGAST